MFTQVKPLGKGTEELRLRCNMYCPCRNCGDLAILLILHRLATKIGIQLKKRKKKYRLVQYTILPMQCNYPKKNSRKPNSKVQAYQKMVKSIPDFFFITLL